MHMIKRTQGKVPLLAAFFPAYEIVIVVFPLIRTLDSEN